MYSTAGSFEPLFTRVSRSGVLRSSHDPHRLSQPVLRITRHSVLFQGSAIVPTFPSFLSRAPKRCLPVFKRTFLKWTVFSTLRRGRTPRQPYSPKYAEEEFSELRLTSQHVEKVVIGPVGSPKLRPNT